MHCKGQTEKRPRDADRGAVLDDVAVIRQVSLLRFQGLPEQCLFAHGLFKDSETLHAEETSLSAIAGATAAPTPSSLLGSEVAERVEQRRPELNVVYRSAQAVLRPVSMLETKDSHGSSREGRPEPCARLGLSNDSSASRSGQPKATDTGSRSGGGVEASTHVKEKDLAFTENQQKISVSVAHPRCVLHLPLFMQAYVF